MKTEFKVDLKKYNTTREKHKKISNWIFIITATIIFTVYYFVFGTESLNAIIYFIISFLIVGFLIYSAMKKGLKNSEKQWKSYSIKLTEESLIREFLEPIHLEFQDTSWNKRNTEIKWENVGIELNPKFVIFDKSVSSLKRKLFNKGEIRIPNEMENKNELIKSIKTFANASS
ncbi:hypothetical protein GZ212_13735 [Mangrovimonas sp. CR14]|uniref:hypothetical protein n=1 Tax=Mangrovimonas sp. CR14 TaxID=2706120 RepID=UPI001420F636|nr:hypothetical protein [Mangrovimonas sp. CR14]NIK93219.1 hypothetical protein [Mangrovimonas sp. CR14]